MSATNDMYRQLLSQRLSGSALIGGSVSGGAMIGGYYPNLPRQKRVGKVPQDEVQRRMNEGYSYIDRRTGETKIIPATQYTAFYNRITNPANKLKAKQTRVATTAAIDARLKSAIEASGKKNLPRLDKDIIIAQTKDQLRKQRAAALNTPEEKAKKKAYRQQYEARKAAEAGMSVKDWRKATKAKRPTTEREKQVRSAVSRDPGVKLAKAQARAAITGSLPRNPFGFPPSSMPSPGPLFREQEEKKG